MLTSSVWLVETTLVSSDPFALDLSRSWSAQPSGACRRGWVVVVVVEEDPIFSCTLEVFERGAGLGFLTFICFPLPQDLCT